MKNKVCIHLFVVQNYDNGHPLAIEKAHIGWLDKTVVDFYLFIYCGNINIPVPLQHQCWAF